MTPVPPHSASTRLDEFRRALHGRTLPRDLTHCLGHKTLLRIVLEEVDRLRNPDRGWGDRRSPGEFSRAFLFTLLGYCYATGALGSLDVELAARADPMVRYLCSGSVPDIDVIRHFRRGHREELMRLLAAVFRRAWEIRFEEAAVDGLPDDSYAAASLSRWHNPRATPDFRSEAHDRLGRAVRADSMALDV